MERGVGFSVEFGGGVGGGGGGGLTRVKRRGRTDALR